MADLPGSVRASLVASLERLGRDYVDLVQLHNTLRDVIGSADKQKELSDALGIGKEE